MGEVEVRNTRHASLTSGSASGAWVAWGQQFRDRGQVNVIYTTHPSH